MMIVLRFERITVLLLRSTKCVLFHCENRGGVLEKLYFIIHILLSVKNLNDLKR